MVNIKEVIKNLLACFLGLMPFLGTIYIIGRIRRKRKEEDSGWIDAYNSVKEGLIPYFKILFPITLIIFILFRNWSIGVDPILLFIYPDLFYPIIIRVLLIRYTFENFVKISFFMTAIEGKRIQDISEVLMDLKKVLVIVGITIVSSLSSIFLGDYAVFFSWKFLTSIIYMFYFVR